MAPKILPTRAGDRLAAQGRELGFDFSLDRIGEIAIVGDEDRLRGGIVLGLGQKIGGNPRGIAGLVGDNQHFARPRDHIDADRAEHLPLGCGDIGVARSHDLHHRRDAPRAIGQSRDRLRAADAINLVDAGKIGRRRERAG